jgi:DNA recombination protein RmuC
MSEISLHIIGALVTACLLSSALTYWLSRLRFFATLEQLTSDAEQSTQEISGLRQQLAEQLVEKQELVQLARIQAAEQQVRVIAQEEQRTAQHAQLTRLTEKNDQLQSDNTRYRERISHLETSLNEQQKQAEEKLALLQQAKAQLNTEFKNIANEIFDAKQKRFSEQSQTQLDGILKPLGERIQAFEKKVEDSYATEAKERFSLIKEAAKMPSI